MKSSYMGGLLVVDLTRETAAIKPIEPTVRQLLVGGKGLGAKLIHDLVPPGADPLGPENVLLFMTGPLTGTRAPAMRGCAVAKSPLTGTFSDSYFGGAFAPEIKYAGYDGVVILGQANRPLYLFIDDEFIKFMDAGALWGLDIFAANARIKAELKDETVKVAGIGPAGEKLCRYALISAEYNRQAGRGGIGAVMGSKNLKAVAVRGSRPVMVKDPDAFAAAVKKAHAELTEKAIGSFTKNGTVGGMGFSNAMSFLPTRNFQDGVFDKTAGIGSDAQRDKLWRRDLACPACSIRCGKVGRLKAGKHKGLASDAVEYELAGLLGSNLGIGEIGPVTRLAELCDRLGLDGISAGSAIGFAMEAFERGLISEKDTGGLELKFGAADAAIEMLKRIAARETELGRLLGEGVMRAAQAIGGEAEKLAVHVKGQECPAWGPRGTPAMGLAQATSDRGACHERAWPIAIELGGKWRDKPLPKLGTQNRAELVIHLQNYAAALDTAVKCDFATWGIKEDTYRALLAAAAGIEFSDEAGLLELGERVWNLSRLINVREGFRRKDDNLPWRIMNEPLKSGANAGHKISREDLDVMLDDYYRLRGWDQDGAPRPETLGRLSLDTLAKLKAMD